MMEGFPAPEPTVVCVLRSGGFQGRKYTPEWVLRLKGMVARNLSVPHRFCCFTDVNIPGVECLGLRFEWPGWWSKIEVFRWNAGCRLLYFDLDVRITGSLDELLNYPAPMALMSAIITAPKPRVVRRYQSSVMVWSPPEGREIFSSFLPNADRIMAEFRGDQDWIGHIKPNCATFPREWFCKPRAHVPASVKVVINDKSEPRLPQASKRGPARASA